MARTACRIISAEHARATVASRIGAEGVISILGHLRAWAAAPGQRRRELRDAAWAEAAEMIARHGDRAYEIARTWHRNEQITGRLDPFRPKGHWGRVRQALGKQIGRDIAGNRTSEYL